ncbi:MAG: PAS domain S-box protein, partial [Bacillota bacterium]|nr:PAS domain S-box protein [Bacillota bacterium]
MHKEIKNNAVKQGNSFEICNQLFENLPAMIWQIGLEGECLNFNKLLLDFLGMKLDEAVGYGWVSKLHPDNRDDSRNIFKQAVENRRQFNTELRLLHCDGDYRWVKSIGNPYYDVEGNLAGYLGVFYDIHNQKLMEENLKKSRDYYLSMFENFPALIWKTDPSQSKTYLSKSLMAFTGKDETDLLGPGWINIVHPKDREKFFKEYKKNCTQKSSFEMQLRLMHKSGEYHWIYAINKPFYDINGNFDGYMGMAIDIQDSRTAIENRLKYEILSKSTRDIILFTDRRGNILDANEAALRVYGYTLDEIRTKKLCNLRTGPGPDIRDLEKAARRGTLYQILHKRKDGTVFPAEVSMQAASIGGREVFVSIIRDITERKKAEKELRESQAKYYSLFMNMSNGLIFSRILLDEGDNPNDFVILESNDAFLNMMGLKRESIVGRRISEIRGNDNLQQQAIKLFGKAALNGGSACIREVYSEKRNKWYDVAIYSPEKYFIACIFTDITESKLVAAEMKRAKEQAEAAN